MNIRRLLPALLLPFVSLPAQETDAHRAMLLAQDARAAADEGDRATWLVKSEEAVALRPDFPRLLLNLAAAQAANDQPEAAIATLERLAEAGYSTAIADAEEFAALREREEFKNVVKTLTANGRPQGEGEVAFTLREMTGLIEGIAWREAADTFYFGDVNGRAVWVRGAKEAKDDKPRRLTPETDELLGVFGVAVDESRGALWAAMSAVSQMQGYTADLAGTAGVAEIDLETGAVRRTVLLPPAAGGRTRVVGDVAVGPDGSVYLSDSGAAQVWRLPPDADSPELLAESPELFSPQGLAVLPGRGAMIVADYSNGLLRVDLGSGEVRRLETPPGAILVGVDGLARAPDGTVLAVQNGIRPNRVLRVTFTGSAESIGDVQVLDAAHFQMGDPTLGCIGPDGDFYFIANAGWSRFGDGNTPTSPRAVAVFKSEL